MLEFCVEMKSMDGVDFSRPVNVKPVSRLRPNLRKFDAIEYSKALPLFGCIINPKIDKFYVGKPSPLAKFADRVRDVPLIRGLNAEQRHVALTSARICTTNPQSSQIVLVQGPPGTGKSTTIVATLLQIYASRSHPDKPKPRVLLTAPSNAAADELLRKLKNIVNDNSWVKGLGINFVRIGALKVSQQ